jgi:hypothetical protein
MIKTDNLIHKSDILNKTIKVSLGEINTVISTEGTTDTSDNDE